VQVKDALRHHFPHVEVNGGNYPAPASKVFLASVLQVVQLSLIGVAIAGDWILTTVFNYPINGPFPSVYESIREKKLYVGIGAWMVGNSFIQSLTSTGAFEIAFNGELIYSKLESTSHQLPTIQHIVSQMIKVNPDMVNSQPPPRSRPVAATSATRRSLNDDSDFNHDVRDMAYDEDRSI